VHIDQRSTTAEFEVAARENNCEHSQICAISGNLDALLPIGLDQLRDQNVVRTLQQLDCQKSGDQFRDDNVGCVSRQRVNGVVLSHPSPRSI